MLSAANPPATAERPADKLPLRGEGHRYKRGWFARTKKLCRRGAASGVSVIVTEIGARVLRGQLLQLLGALTLTLEGTPRH